MLTRRTKVYSSFCSQTVSLSPAISSQFIFRVFAVAKDHGLCGSNKLLYKRCAKSMGRPKFRPSTAPTFFNRS